MAFRLSRKTSRILQLKIPAALNPFHSGVSLLRVRIVDVYVLVGCGHVNQNLDCYWLMRLNAHVPYYTTDDS